MKKVLNILIAVLLTANIFGQAAQTLSYQAMVSNSNNDLLALGSETSAPVDVERSNFTNEASALASTHYIGEFYGGGIVFYLDDEGKHGFVTNIIDKRVRKQQINETQVITNAVRVGINAGIYKTDRINAMNNAETNDLEVVETYQEANLSDWYLPTRYDLIRLYNNRAVVGGYTEFARGWKSTQVSSVNEWFKSFVTGGEFSNGKDDEVYVRVIRKF